MSMYPTRPLDDETQLITGDPFGNSPVRKPMSAGKIAALVLSVILAVILIAMLPPVRAEAHWLWATSQDTREAYGEYLAAWQTAGTETRRAPATTTSAGS